MPIRIVLVRHGQSMATVRRVVGGPKGDTGLSDLGREQATKLRDRLQRTGEIAADVVGASVLPRAIETAEIVFPGRDVRTDCDWCELHPGECDGMVWDDYVATYDSGPPDADRPMSPGGESLRTFDARVRQAFDAIVAANAGRTVAIVTHGGFISAATRYVLGDAPMTLRSASSYFLDPDNTSITAFSRASGADPWIFERFNDVAHLA